MSSRNSQKNKQAAREKMRAERERQAKKDKVRRQLTVAGGVVAVLAIAAGIGFAVSQSGGDDEASGAWKDARKAKLVKPAHTTGKDGTTILYGSDKAKETLTVYEDPRCPACAAFEQSAGDQLLQDVKDDRYRVRYLMVNFIDDNGGTGSKNAVSALGAALNVSTDAFVDYKKALYSTKNHPDERDDAFAKDANLIKIAQQVPALKGNKSFDNAVKKGTYDRWALEMGDFFGKNGVNSTPTFLHGDKKLTAEGGNPPMSKEQYVAVIDKEFGAKKG